MFFKQKKMAEPTTTRAHRVPSQLLKIHRVREHLEHANVISV